MPIFQHPSATGDGIGPEVRGHTGREDLAASTSAEASYEERRIGGAAIRDEGAPSPTHTRSGTPPLRTAGGRGPPGLRRRARDAEAGLLELRQHLVRREPHAVHGDSVPLGASPLKKERGGVDVRSRAS